MNDVYLKPKKERIEYLDLIRVIACIMVIMAHCCDTFIFLTDSPNPDAYGFVAFLRPCVPFFIMLSGALILPMQTDSATFFKRRFSRVLIPFLVWSVLYALLPVPSSDAGFGTKNVFAKMVEAGDLPVTLYNLVMIPFNFTSSNVHFWFIFILIGLYLFAPIISPWLREAKQKSILTFLAIWGVTLFLPYIGLLFPEILGVCTWNKYGTLYYFSGYLGYMILGYYLVKYPLKSVANALGIGGVLYIVGLVLTAIGFAHSAEIYNDVSVIAANYNGTPPPELYKAIDRSAVLEFHIDTLTINVVIMSAGLFMILQRVKLPQFCRGVVTQLSNLSYGIFLMHYIVCLWIAAWVTPCFAKSPEWLSGPGFQIPLRTLIVLVICWVVTTILSKLPKSKYIIG